MIHVGVDELSVALLMLAVSLSVALGFKGSSPDTPHVRLIAQSEVSRTREKNESAVYRSRLAYSGFKVTYDGCKTVHEVIQKLLASVASNPCLGWKTPAGTFAWRTYAEVFESAMDFGSGLVSLGLEPKSLVGILLKNGPEWVVADFGMMGHSFVSVAINENLQKEEIERILRETSLTALICSDERLPEILELSRSLPSLQHVIVVGGSPSQPEGSVKVHQFKQVEIAGKEAGKPFNPVAPTAPSTIVYTSGGSGSPKGVVLTQQNLVSSIAAFIAGFPSGLLKKGDRYFSYLPLSLPLERVHVLATLCLGGQIGFGDNMNKLFDDIRILKPNFFVSVPRLWAPIYFKIIQFVQSSALKKALFQYVFEQRKKSLRRGILEKNSIWDSLIFNSFKDILGGNVRFLISTSESLSPEVADFLRICFGCNVYEGYYQAESSGFTTMTMTGDYQAGHVGTPLACNEIKLIDVPELSYFVTDTPNPRGEICIRGPNVFKEYFNNPEATKQAIDEQGWLRTGDLGIWLPNRTLKVVGRKSQSFKIGEEVVNLDQLQNLYSRSSFVSQIFLSLTPNKLLEALIVPNAENLLEWSKENKVEGDLPSLCTQPQVHQALFKKLNEIGTQNGLGGPQKISKISLQAHPFGKGFLTPTLQPRRGLIVPE